MTQQTKQVSNGSAKKDNTMHMPSMPKGKAAVATMAGVAGAVVGAGVAVAATQILSDEKNRAKVKQTFDKVKTQVMDTIHEEQKRMNASQAGQKTLGNGSKPNQKTSKKAETGKAAGTQMSV